MNMNIRNTAPDCLFIGGSTQDLLMLTDRIPGPDERSQDFDYEKCCGGVSATAASAYRKLGGRAGVITVVGNDDAGQFIRQDLEAQGFMECRILQLDAPSSVSLIQVDGQGKRSIVHFGGCIRKLKFDMLDKELLESVKILHLGVMEEELMVKLGEFCKERTDLLLSIDGGNLAGPLAEKLLPCTDIWILDEGTVEKTLGMQPREACVRYWEMAGKENFFTAVTLGEKGAIGYDGKRFLTVSPYKVPVTDTTGAGDNYHGAFLYAFIQGWKPEKCMEFAGIFAGLTCRECGGRKGEPSKEEVLKIMEERKK